jgi:hypothetical protein
MREDPTNLRDWDSLDPDEQTRLRVEFGHWLDQLPPTCDLGTKIERFRTWLREERGVDWRG